MEGMFCTTCKSQTYHNTYTGMREAQAGVFSSLNLCAHVCVKTKYQTRVDLMNKLLKVHCVRMWLARADCFKLIKKSYSDMKK